MKKYSIGIDYGTLSARALLVNLEDGRECATAVYEFPHAVMSETFLDGTPLPADFALQHPADYIEAFENVIPAVLREAGVAGDEIADFIFIQNELEKISVTVETLQLWAEKMLANGHIDAEAYRAQKNK